MVAEFETQVGGFIKAVYDGSRALIHLVSVDPRFKNKGIGKRLIDEACCELKKRGAPSISVSVTDASFKYWEKFGFEKLPVYLMLRNF